MQRQRSLDSSRRASLNLRDQQLSMSPPPAVKSEMFPQQPCDETMQVPGQELSRDDDLYHF